MFFFSYVCVCVYIYKELNGQLYQKKNFLNHLLFVGHLYGQTMFKDVFSFLSVTLIKGSSIIANKKDRISFITLKIHQKAINSTFKKDLFFIKFSSCHKMKIGMTLSSSERENKSCQCGCSMVYEQCRIIFNYFKNGVFNPFRIFFFTCVI